MIVEHRIKVTDPVYLTVLQVDGVTWIEADEFTGVYYDSVDKVLRTFPVPVFGRETFMPVKRLENQVTRTECTVLSVANKETGVRHIGQISFEIPDGMVLDGYVPKQEENGNLVLSVTFRPPKNKGQARNGNLVLSVTFKEKDKK